MPKWSYHQLTSLRPTSKPLPPPQSSSISPFIRPFKPVCISISSAEHRGQQSEPDHTHTHIPKDGEADRPGKQTSHSPMVHLMFHDLTASDVSFPKTHRASKDESRTTESQNKLCLPKCEDGQMEAKGQGQVKETLGDRGEGYLKHRGRVVKVGGGKRGCLSS